MSNIHFHASIATYDFYGKKTYCSIPIFDSYPHDIEYVCSNQRFTIDTNKKQILLNLSYTFADGLTAEEVVDLTEVCINNSPIKLCIVRTDDLYELVFYQDRIRNGKIKLSITLSPCINPCINNQNRPLL